MNIFNTTNVPLVGDWPAADGDAVVLLMPPWGYTASAVVLFFIGFFGFFFNLIVIVLMYKDIQVWIQIEIRGASSVRRSIFNFRPPPPALPSRN